MIKQIIFILALCITLGVFFWTMSRIYRFFRFTRPFPVGNYGKRFMVMLRVAFAQSKIFRRPVIGLLHALVFWGFLVILAGSVEMVIDGIFGTDRVMSALGGLYNLITASGDVFALLVLISILVFLSRRLFFSIRRFSGIEMEHKSHLDANIALTIILFLMVSLIGMNTFYILSHPGHVQGVYPVSSLIASLFPGLRPDTVHVLHEVSWWGHILLIFLFANILPYSKHFHVFMSVFNVLLCRLDPLGKLPNMDQVTREVKTMMDPAQAYAAPPADQSQVVERFGVKDVEDGTWKNYLDSLSCTECGRCTASCPANITGKKLSPRKIMMNYRARMKEKGPGMIKNGKEYNDERALLRTWISEEELWACTTCNACACECPININHPTLIIDMRRYLVMEEGSAPAALKSVFANIENNGAPWQFSPEDRLRWAEGLSMNKI